MNKRRITRKKGNPRKARKQRPQTPEPGEPAPEQPAPEQTELAQIVVKYLEAENKKGNTNVR